jgi:hypothetical protein
MRKKKKKSGFTQKELPQPEDALAPRPEFSQFSSTVKRKLRSYQQQDPALQHELSVEDNSKLSPDRGGLRLSLLYDTQHPLNALPPKLKKRIDLMMMSQETIPSMANYSNLEAPIPMKPKDRPV